jgi:uncharacterized protein (TIGR02145 family)
MVTAGIFALMTALLVAKYGSFNDTTILTNTAYDVALAIRGAQSYGMNAPASGAQNVNYPYGIHFDTSNSTTQTQMTFFEGANSGDYVYSGANTITTYTLKNGGLIKSVCVGTSNEDCSSSGITSLDVTFKYSDPNAIITATNGSSAIQYPYAEIVVENAAQTSTRTIYVRETGEIALNPSGPCGSYGTVLAKDGNCWLDRNLGATEVATSSTDYKAYGSMFQWGRLADGHQLITWTNSTTGTVVNGTTNTLSSSDNPNNGGLFIAITTSPFDWRSSQNDNLWQRVSGTNNPCPTGFRLPTQTEWANLVKKENIIDSATAYSSSLKLTAAGFRNASFGSGLGNVGGAGYYWSSSVLDPFAYYLSFNSFSVSSVTNGSRAYGFSVRCIKN